MKSTYKFKVGRLCSAAALASVSAAAAQAATVSYSGNFNAHGYNVIAFSVVSPGSVDILYTGGFGDPTFSLFDSIGNHLISNDDAPTAYSHITQNLAAGAYSLLVSFCCGSTAYAENHGALFASTDGFNSGTFWLGGAGTLSGMQLNLDGLSFVGGQPYALNISSPSAAGVPEPTPLALLGLALASLALRRRKA